MNKLSILALLALVFPQGAAMAAVDNLNTHSTLADEGYEFNSAPKMVFGDIPVMEGLAIPKDDFVRVLPTASDENKVVMVGIVDVDETYNFYKREMRKLGWTSISARDYAKTDRTFSVNVVGNGKITTVTFTQKNYAPQ